MKLTTWLTPWPDLVGMHVSVSESEAFAKNKTTCPPIQVAIWGCPSFIKAIKNTPVIMYIIVY